MGHHPDREEEPASPFARTGIVATLFLSFAAASAAADCTDPVGRLASVQGQVVLQYGTDPTWQQAHLDAPLCPGTKIQVGERSRALAVLVRQTQTEIPIDQNTTLTIVEVPQEGQTLIDLLQGAAYFFSRRPRRVEIRTPVVNAAIEGTEFVLQVDAGQTRLDVFEGRVMTSNAAGTLAVTGGQAMVARAGAAPRPDLVVRPRNAVQWALYYPAILVALADPSGRAAASLPQPLSGAVAAAAAGDLPAAFEQFDAVPADRRDALFHVYRAGALLMVGRVEEAHAEIDAALALEPSNGDALSLSAIIAVAQNQNTRALDDSRRAVEASPGAAAPKIALSYALQAEFDIDGAGEALEQAVHDEPGNALAWARLSEVRLMQGRRPSASRAARTAAALAPDLARTQVVLGFAALVSIETRRAREAFERAIAINSDDPQARLGLGLARIRAGQLRDGRGDIEIAVGLDPNNSLLRSYLGKAYFEEKRDPLDGVQYQIAKELDPNDPTPWFYDAIRKQTINRPVEALHDLQHSIELNDNRAVYRSRELLDEDRASRGASLGRIYSDLGFDQLGVNEATKSLTIDPANASAHRFLSDTYAGQPRREIARASELLQSQLLQDININPVQPSLIETDLNIVTQGGPATAGFNEYNTLFERNQAQFNATGILGSEWTRGAESVVSGIYDRFSLSAGQFHYQTDGFRENDHIQHDVYDIYAQAAVTPELNVQAEYRRRNSELGDVGLNFDWQDFSPAQHTDIDSDTARIGVRYSPTVSSDVLGSMIYSHRDAKVQDTSTDEAGFVSDTTSLGNQDGFQWDGQYIFHGERVSVTTGGSYSDINTHSKFQFTDQDFQITVTPEDVRFDTRQGTVYAYANADILDDVVLTAGLSYDDYHQRETDSEDPHPKIGLQWFPTTDLRFRAAFFETLKPTLIASQTLQPTQIAGFGQFFDDVNGTRSTNYAAGFDARFSQDVYLTTEVFARDLDVPISNSGQSIDQNEQLYSTALYWTPFLQWALSAEVRYDRFHSDEDIVSVPEDLDTFSIPLTAKYFSDTGLFAGISLAYVNQQIKWFEGQKDYQHGDENLFNLNTSIGYRFPYRLGMISFQARNLLNERFNYKDDTFREIGSSNAFLSPLVPERAFFAVLTINL